MSVRAAEFLLSLSYKILHGPFFCIQGCIHYALLGRQTLGQTPEVTPFLDQLYLLTTYIYQHDFNRLDLPLLPNSAIMS